MRPTVKRLLSAASTCRKAVCSCASCVRKIILRCLCLRPKKKMAGESDKAMTVVTSAEKRINDSREAIDSQSNPSDRTAVTVAMTVRPVVTPTPVDDTLAVVSEEKPKNRKRTKRNRRNKRKSGEDARPQLPSVESMAEEKPEKTTPADSSTLRPSASAPCSVSKNEKETRTSRVTKLQPRDAVQVSQHCGRTDVKQPPPVVSDDVSRAKEQRCDQTTETSFSLRVQQAKTDGNCKGDHATDVSNASEVITKSSEVLQRCNTLGAAIAKRNTAGIENTTAATAAVVRKAIPNKLQSDNGIELNRAEKAWIPRMAMRKTTVAVQASTYAGAAKKRPQYTTEELNKKATSILNKIAPENAVKLTENFKNLPIDTIESLDSIATLVFEKAIGEQCFAPLYAALCSAMQNVLVTCPVSKKQVSFKALILGKCQNAFEVDKIDCSEAAAKAIAKINSCTNPEEKMELQLGHEEKERRTRKRSVGNCRFIGELFKQRMITTNIIRYCITNLVDQRSEQPLESLCNLLTIAGEEFERRCDLDETFAKLKALTSDKGVSSRIKFMIRDLTDLRSNKWSGDVKMRKI